MGAVIMITILQIDYFLELVKYMNFSKTAEKLYISQPALSKQISNLEKELGFMLFDRNGKNIELNADGELMYNFFVATKDDFNSIVSKIKQKNEVLNLNISCLTGWEVSRYFLDVNTMFDEKDIKVNLHLESRELVELVDNINNNVDDIVITISDNLENFKNINSRYLTDIKRLIVYSKSSRLNNKKNLDLSDFKNEKFFVFTKLTGKSSIEILNDICKQFGFEPDITQVSNIDSMMLNVETGRGVAIFDEWHRVLNNPTLKYIDTGTTHKIYAAWKKDNQNKAINSFLDIFENVIKQKH